MVKKIKAMFSKSSANTRAPVDLNQPVENPALLKAIQRVASEGTDDSKDQLLIELQKANYIAAMVDDDLKTSPTNETGQITIQKGSTFGVLSAEKDGANYLVLFTDWQALRAYTENKVSGWILPANHAWSFALQGETYDGVVINPAHNALPLGRPMLEFLVRNERKSP